MQIFNSSQIRKFGITCYYIYFILNEKGYIIQFISKLNKFESLTKSMVPQIENLTHILDIGNTKREINIWDNFSENKIKYDLFEHTASKSTVLRRLVIIKHEILCSLLRF